MKIDGQAGVGAYVMAKAMEQQKLGAEVLVATLQNMGGAQAPAPAGSGSALKSQALAAAGIGGKIDIAV